jgi:endonuclease/exonuclease/phosphatase family metal-dependent hydrolase
MRILFISLLISCFSGKGLLLAQSIANPNQKGAKTKVFTMPDAGKRGNNAVRLVFYNTENLFDIADDSITNDNEYTPTGMRGWTYNKFQRKILNLSKVFISIGGWEAPEIIGMCEIENRYVLIKLINDTPLKNIGYKIIQKDSPDPRGIDVAMIYRPDKFVPISYKAIPVRFPKDPSSRTRDILYVKGKVLGQEVLHVFINHWPSRYGGYAATKPKRAVVASILRHATDSIMQDDPNARVVIMGDFNDEPNDESITKVLMARGDSTHLDRNDLYNMMSGYAGRWRTGTNKFHESWSVIDQMIVSSSMLHAEKGLTVNANAAHIFDAPFLLMEDKTYFGMKPFRTYLGPRYQGGFSDHLPVYMDLNLRVENKNGEEK